MVLSNEIGKESIVGNIYRMVLSKEDSKGSTIDNIMLLAETY